MNFQQAKKAMQKGALVRRKGWEYNAISSLSGKNTPKLFLRWRDRQWGWIADSDDLYKPTQEDMVSNEWELVVENLYEK